MLPKYVKWICMDNQTRSYNQFIILSWLRNIQDAPVWSPIPAGWQLKWQVCNIKDHGKDYKTVLKLFLNYILIQFKIIFTRQTLLKFCLWKTNSSTNFLIKMYLIQSEAFCTRHDQWFTNMFNVPNGKSSTAYNHYCYNTCYTIMI